MIRAFRNRWRIIACKRVPRIDKMRRKITRRRHVSAVETTFKEQGTIKTKNNTRGEPGVKNHPVRSLRTNQKVILLINLACLASSPNKAKAAVTKHSTIN